MPNKAITSRAEWYAGRQSLLIDEKRLTDARDAVNAARLRLPKREFVTTCRFEGAEGEVSFERLFGRYEQLIVYHFLFPKDAGPGHPAWRRGVDGCAFVADHVDAARLHLLNRGVNLICLSEAPFDQIDAFKRRMGWKFPWYGGVTEQYHGEVFSPAAEALRPFPGLSAYQRKDGRVFLTYVTSGRGSDLLIGAYNYLDISPLGRNENQPMDWVRFHDEY